MWPDEHSCEPSKPQVMLGILKLSLLLLLVLLVVASARRRPKQAKGRKEVEEDEEDVEEDIDWGEELENLSREEVSKKKRSVTDYLQPPTVLDPKEDEIPRSFSAYFTKENFKADDFLNAHHIYFKDSEKKFPELEILSYVTPWNRKGKEHAQLMAHKLNWVSPCWYQIRRKEDGSNDIEITGTHDEDWDWISSLFEELDSDGQCRQDLRIVPRVILETSLASEGDIEIVSEKLVEIMERVNAKITKPGMKFIHGFALEVIQEMAVAVSLPRSLKIAIPDISLVMVLPPIEVNPQDTRTLQALEALSSAVDRFSVMTYDADRNGNPHAPIEWITRVIKGLLTVPSMKDKLLLGLPHYGWKTGGEDMTSEKMTLWLAKGGVVGGFDEESQEHYFTDKTGKRSSFPSPEMLRARLQLAVDLGIPGVAIWEMGQGSAAFIEVY